MTPEVHTPAEDLLNERLLAGQPSSLYFIEVQSDARDVYGTPKTYLILWVASTPPR